MVQSNGKEVRLAITARDKDEADKLRYVSRNCGFAQHSIFHDPRQTVEVAKREQYQIFITYHGFPDMTGLTMIQSLRATGNYGLESHLFLVDAIDRDIMVVLAEHNIKYVVQKPFNSDVLGQKLAALWQDEISLSPYEIAYRESHAAFQSGLYDMAFELAVNLLKTYKVHEKTLLLLGDICMKLDRLEEARKFYQKAHETFPDSYVPAHKLAQVFMREENFEQATLLLDKLAKLSPLNIEILANTGLSNFHIGRFQEAKAAMSQLKALDRQHKDANKVLAKVAIQEGDFRTSVRLLQDCFDPLESLNILHQEARRFREQKSFVRVIDLYLQHLEPMANSPYLCDLYYHLGLAYKEIYDERAAIHYLKKALELKPDFNDAAKALQALSKKVI